MKKEALDNAAKNYWSEYFKEYGQMWVRDVPRRIKNAMKRKFKATNIDGSIAPIAASVANNGILSVEAGFIGNIDNKAARVLILASFDEDGKLETFNSTRIS